MRIYFHFLHFIRCQQGNVFILLALSVMMIVASTGAAVDMARAQTLQARIQSALDAAGLAAGATANTPPSTLPGFCGTSTWVQCEAQRYFSANFPAGYLGSAAVTVTATQGGANNSVVTLTASTTQSTTFMKVVGINSVSVAANSQITLANSGMELVLVLDNTGSMAYAVNPANDPTTKIQALQAAATQLMNIIYGSNTTIPNLWVGLVPFSQAVNIGTGHTAWMASTTADFGPAITGNTCQTYTGVTPNVYGTHSTTCTTAVSQIDSDYGAPHTCSTCTYNAATNFGLTNWGGCVMARSSPYDVTDDAPSSSTPATLFSVYQFPPTLDSVDASVVQSWFTYTWYPNITNLNPWLTTGSSTLYDYSISPFMDSSAQGPNSGCPQQITQMTANENTILTAIGSLQAIGDTDLDLGMVWGWRMLSPNWAGLWGGEMNNSVTINSASYSGLPLPYNTPMMKKVVVFMTDGMDRFISGDYSGYGFLGNSLLGTTITAANASTQELTVEETLDARFLSVCNAMKQNGIIIYTIGFGNASPDNPPTENDRGNDLLVDTQLLQSCATQNYSGDTSHYFLAPTNAQLSSAFQQIAGQLANLRVSQ